MAKKHFYGKGMPGVKLGQLKGTLVVVEGGDGAGRSTQIQLLREWLERMGYPTTEIGLKRSNLVGKELDQAMQGNVLCPITLSLFYATDLADQLESSIIPSLRAGFVVIADRYIYTLMGRDIMRGANPTWIRDVYGLALVPDIIFYLKVNPRVLAERSFRKQGTLDYWESGADIQRSGDMYQCFIKYQTGIKKLFTEMETEYGFEVIDGHRHPLTVHADIQERIKKVLKPAKHQAMLGETVRPPLENLRPRRHAPNVVGD